MVLFRLSSEYKRIVKAGIRIINKIGAILKKRLISAYPPSMILYDPEKNHNIKPDTRKKAKAKNTPAGEQKTDFNSLNTKAFIYLVRID